MRCLRSIAALSLLLTAANASAQQTRTHAPDAFADARPTNCAERTAAVDGINQSVAPAELIIVISRPGDGETRPDLSRRRLHNVRAYWMEFLPAEMRRRPETIILGEGEKVAGFGRLEFYTRGTLFYVIKLRRNEDLHIGECYPPDDSYIRNHVFYPCEVKTNEIFYPCRDAKVRSRRERD